VDGHFSFKFFNVFYLLSAHQNAVWIEDPTSNGGQKGGQRWTKRRSTVDKKAVNGGQKGGQK
jgi:hypothetical protein